MHLSSCNCAEWHQSQPSQGYGAMVLNIIVPNTFVFLAIYNLGLKIIQPSWVDDSGFLLLIFLLCTHLKFVMVLGPALDSPRGSLSILLSVFCRACKCVRVCFCELRLCACPSLAYSLTQTGLIRSHSAITDVFSAHWLRFTLNRAHLDSKGLLHTQLSPAAVLIGSVCQFY